MSSIQPVASAAQYNALVERDAALAELERARAGVTVCVTYHDEPQDVLWRALDSALKQTVKPYEIIIVDDGSEARPLNVVWQNPNELQIRCVSVTNRGLPAARNVGLMLAKTEAFLPLDADDWLDPAYIEKTLPLLADADVVLTGLQEHGPTRNGTYLPGYDRPYDQVTLEMLWQMNRFYYCSLFRTETLREIGGYNPLMAGPWNEGGGYEDFDVFIDLMTREARFACCPEILFNYSTASTDSMVHRAARNQDALHAEMRRHHRRVT